MPMQDVIPTFDYLMADTNEEVDELQIILKLPTYIRGK